MTTTTKAITGCAMLLIVVSVVIFFEAAHRSPTRRASAPITIPPRDYSQGNAILTSPISNARPISVRVEQYKNVPSWMTPLVSAAGAGDLEAMKVLIAEGANVNERPKGFHGWTPLITAITNGQRTNVVDFLLEHGADPNVKEFHGQTALNYAIALGDDYTNLVQRLIVAGADVNAKDNDGNTVLRYAKPDSAIAEILKRAGAKQ